MTTLLKLYNKGKRTILGAHETALGEEAKTYAFKPETSMAFSQTEAEKLRRLYPREIIDMESVTRDFDEKTRVADEKEKTISVAAAEAEKKAAIAVAVSKEVALALQANDEKHEAARIAAEIKSSEEIAAAQALLDEKAGAPADASGDDDAFARVNTVNKALGVKNTK